MGKDEKPTEYEYSKVPTKQIIAEKQEIPTHYGYGVRHIQLLICFLCMTVNFIGRGHMGVTVVSMTSPTQANHTILYLNETMQTNIENFTNIKDIGEANTTREAITGYVSNQTIDANLTESFHKTFEWPKSTQEMVLGSFFLGYCIMTFPMGLVVQRFGGKIPLQIALSINGVVSILTPWLVNWGGWKAVCACRIAQGLSQSGVYPSIQNLLAKWVPVNERGSLSSYVYTGAILGTIVAYQLSGYISESICGWPSTFWAVGAICLCTFAILTIFGAASPAVHKSISEEEKNYIMGRVDDGSVKRLKTPWKALALSRPLWGVLATHVGSGIAFAFFFNQVPSYIHYILGVNVRSSGLLSSLPYAVSFFTSISFGVISDFLTNRNILSIKNSRRVFNSFSQCGVAVALVCVTFTTNTAVAVTCLAFSMGCHMAIHVGWMVNHIDMSPNFSGTLMMLGNTLMNICNVLVPLLISYVVTDVYNQTQWRTIFLLVAGIAISTNALFVILMSADLQPWNEGFQKDKCIEEPESENEKESKK